MKPLIDDGQTCEEYKSSARKKGKSKEEQEMEMIYRMRCRMVALCRNYSQFLDYVRKNAHLLSKMDAVSRECMRRLCQESQSRYARYYSPDDSALFDRTFGPFIPANMSSTIYQGTPISLARDDTPKTLDDQVVVYTNTAYQTFIQWLSDSTIQAELSSRPDLKFKLQLCIDTNRRHNFVPVPNRGYREYHPDDEELFRTVLDSMRG